MQLVRESISFQRYKDPKDALGVGKRAHIEKWLDEMGITNYDINYDDNKTIDINEDVYLSSKDLIVFPEYINFNKIDGDFHCDYNHLNSLRGSPITVKGSFTCSGNLLTSLKDCPITVEKSFDCSHNKLLSLKICPVIIGGGFNCTDNQLISLEGCPKTVGTYFYCSNNQLTSLEGCPKTVGTYFYCFNNQLTSLEGCPKRVKENFVCGNNITLFTKRDVRKYCKVKGNIIC